MTEGWLPPYAYVPGKTERHPEEVFDGIKAGVSDGLGVGELFQTEAWCVGLRCFEEGYFWEAHELWEPVWMACAPNSGERLLVQAVIQLANAGLKSRMDRDGAKTRLLQQADVLFSEAVLRRATLPNAFDWGRLRIQIFAL